MHVCLRVSEFVHVFSTKYIAVHFGYSVYNLLLDSVEKVTSCLRLLRLLFIWITFLWFFPQFEEKKMRRGKT